MHANEREEELEVEAVLNGDSWREERPAERVADAPRSPSPTPSSSEGSQRLRYCVGALGLSPTEWGDIQSRRSRLSPSDQEGPILVSPSQVASATLASTAQALSQGNQGSRSKATSTTPVPVKSLAEGMPPLLSVKRKARELEEEGLDVVPSHEVQGDPFIIQVDDVPCLIAPIRDVVNASFPVEDAALASTRGAVGEPITSSRVCLPDLVAERVLHQDPNLRGEDPAVHTAIHIAMGSRQSLNGLADSTRGEAFADFNLLAASRSKHLQSKESGLVLPYDRIEPVRGVEQGRLTKVPRTLATHAQPRDHPLLQRKPVTEDMTPEEKKKIRKKFKDQLGVMQKYNQLTAETIQANKGFLVSTDLPRTSTHYSGMSLPSGKKGKEKEDLHAAFNSGEIYKSLRFFTQVEFKSPQQPGEQPVTLLYDAEARLWGLRSDLPRFVAEILQELAEVIPVLMSQTTVLKRQREQNNRGLHDFTLYGFDRQNTGHIKPPSFEGIGINRKVFWGMYYGSVLERLTKHAARLLELFFPQMASRIKKENARIKAEYGFDCPFIYWWNLCINAPLPSEGIHRVMCRPHVDSKNGALLLCAVFVYYYGKVPNRGEREHIWLVLWEAGIVIEIPVGVFILYPSALFLHFNIDKRHLDKVMFYYTKNDQPPTKEFLKPLGCDNSEEGGRASIVWFTQASMLQSADLPQGVHTMGQARDLEKEAQRRAPRAEPYYVTTYDAADALSKGIFPLKTDFQLPSLQTDLE
ncbi:hypothetical protein K474DRAFT_1704272 [Panus rudis PR-1116 ss-1]|nr:hypothetical protein K474DRAFT_1704272 [Panus rudis PR-1116 ss-1]